MELTREDLKEIRRRVNELDRLFWIRVKRIRRALRMEIKRHKERISLIRQGIRILEQRIKQQ
ncbi:MAG TPA: hypothetical protein ENG61_01140 [Candidatus Korarchaeota archaeon]|nr:hypothetical protein [Candidatus Korarchaeota archaeon]